MILYENRATIVEWIGKKEQSCLNFNKWMYWGNDQNGPKQYICFDWSKGCGGDPRFETKLKKWWRHVKWLPTQPLQSVL